MPTGFILMVRGMWVMYADVKVKTAHKYLEKYENMHQELSWFKPRL